MLHFEDPRVTDHFGIDFTRLNLRQRILPSVYEQVVLSAQLMQEDNDVPFDKGNIIFHPKRNYLYQVKSVLDNRHRMGIGSINLQ